MSAINSVTFNAGSTGTDGTYNVGDPISVAVNWTPDVPSTSPETFTLTNTITNSAGAVTATNQTNFVVNQPQAAADTLAASDGTSRVWTVGAPVVNSDGTETSAETATA